MTATTPPASTVPTFPSAPQRSVIELLGEPPAPRTGRERLIGAAIELVYRYGFGAVGIDQVIELAGVTKSTFYKHFESRDDLMVATVERQDEWESRAWGRAVKAVAGDDPAAQLLGMVDVMDQWFNEPQFRGCIFINAAIEYPNPRHPIHQAAAAYKRKAIDRRRELAIAAGAGREEAQRFADGYTALLEGAFVLRQTQGRNDAAKAIRPAVEALMAAMLGARR